MPQMIVTTKFYEFSQNNSGGRFTEDENVGPYVIIEAQNARDANRRAEEIGIYFDGCARGWDCSCCGDRWYSLWDDEEGSDVPSIYGAPVESAKPTWARGYVIVHYVDGTVKRIKLGGE